jgi:hypothetical protein
MIGETKADGTKSGGMILTGEMHGIERFILIACESQFVNNKSDFQAPEKSRHRL